MNNIRNFCIIAHIDHGKSTIADRLIEYTNTLKDIPNQVLDNMDLERERGITIKSHAIQMKYYYNDIEYILNLIDTPGHVDFSYEVLRSINVCEGALLIVDASQGIQSQTIANLQLAINNKLNIIPIINKVDVTKFHIDTIKNQLIRLIDCKDNDIILASGKTGQGVKMILSSIINNISPPENNNKNELKAIIFDSVYDSYKGVILYFRVFQGKINKGDKIKFYKVNYKYTAEEVGILKIKRYATTSIDTGNVGYVVTGIKDPELIKIGDIIIHANDNNNYDINNYFSSKPNVFVGIYPVNNKEYSNFKKVIDQLKLNDPSLNYKIEKSPILGLGLRCGFLGTLHMDIIKERLIREFNISIIMTMPSVSYYIYNNKGQKTKFNNPNDIPDSYSYIEEPFMIVNIITTYEFIGSVIDLCIKKRGNLIDQIYIDNTNIELIFEIPLSEIVLYFYDKLKIITKGYSSFKYSYIEHRKSNLVKMNIKLNDKKLDAFAFLIHIDEAYRRGKKICKKLKEILPRHQFEIKIQASINNKIIARETIKPVRKDVTSKCYGGDISRKRKLLENQKKGKKTMQKIGNIDIPHNTFISVLKID